MLRICTLLLMLALPASAEEARLSLGLAAAAPVVAARVVVSGGYPNTHGNGSVKSYTTSWPSIIDRRCLSQYWRSTGIKISSLIVPLKTSVGR